MSSDTTTARLPPLTDTSASLHQSIRKVMDESQSPTRSIETVRPPRIPQSSKEWVTKDPHITIVSSKSLDTRTTSQYPERTNSSSSKASGDLASNKDRTTSKAWWSRQAAELERFYAPTKSNMLSVIGELKATFLPSQSPFNKPKTRYRILACHYSHHHPMFWLNEGKDMFEYVTLTKTDTDEDLLMRCYPIKWAEECNILQQWHVDRYVNRFWRRKAGWNFVARLDPNCEQWQEFACTTKKSCLRKMVKDGRTEKQELSILGPGRDRGNIVLFVLERKGGREQVEPKKETRKQGMRISEEEPKLALSGRICEREGWNGDCQGSLET